MTAKRPFSFPAPAVAFTPSPECDSPAICSVSESCAGQFNTKKQCDFSQVPTPVLYVSSAQLAELPGSAVGSGYIPARKTPQGLMNLPLYAAPPGSASRELSLSLCIKMLARQLKRADPDSAAAAGAIDLLRRLGLLGTITRDVPACSTKNVPADSSTGAACESFDSFPDDDPPKSVPAPARAKKGR